MALFEAFKKLLQETLTKCKKWKRSGCSDSTPMIPDAVTNAHSAGSHVLMTHKDDGHTGSMLKLGPRTGYADGFASQLEQELDQRLAYVLHNQFFDKRPSTGEPAINQPLKTCHQDTTNDPSFATSHATRSIEDNIVDSTFFDAKADTRSSESVDDELDSSNTAAIDAGLPVPGSSTPSPTSLRLSAHIESKVSKIYATSVHRSLELSTHELNGTTKSMSIITDQTGRVDCDNTDPFEPEYLPIQTSHNTSERPVNHYDDQNRDLVASASSVTSRAITDNVKTRLKIGGHEVDIQSSAVIDRLPPDRVSEHDLCHGSASPMTTGHTYVCVRDTPANLSADFVFDDSPKADPWVLRSKKEGRTAKLHQRIGWLTAELSKYKDENARLTEVNEDLHTCNTANLEYITKQQAEHDQFQSEFVQMQKFNQELKLRNLALEQDNQILSGKVFTTQYRLEIQMLRRCHDPVDTL